MKKIFLLVTLLMFSISVFAEQEVQNNRIKLSNKNFELKFSTCTAKSSTCLNEYYRLKEYGNNWTELVTVHYMGKQKDVLTYAKRLHSVSPYSDNIMYNQDKDFALVSFFLPYKSEKKKGMIEQNIFRIEKAPDGKGLMAIQYAVRHPFDTKEEQAAAQDLIKNVLEKYLMKIANVKIPEIVREPFQKW